MFCIVPISFCLVPHIFFHFKFIQYIYLGLFTNRLKLIPMIANKNNVFTRLQLDYSWPFSRMWRFTLGRYTRFKKKKKNCIPFSPKLSLLETAFYFKLRCPLSLSLSHSLSLSLWRTVHSPRQALFSLLHFPLSQFHNSFHVFFLTIFLFLPYHTHTHTHTHTHIHTLKIKESEKIDKYLNLARELKKQWNMKVTVIPIVVGALGSVPKGL